MRGCPWPEAAVPAAGAGAERAAARIDPQQVVAAPAEHLGERQVVRLVRDAEDGDLGETRLRSHMRARFRGALGVHCERGIAWGSAFARTAGNSSHFPTKPALMDTAADASCTRFMVSSGNEPDDQERAIRLVDRSTGDNLHGCHHSDLLERGERPASAFP